MNIKKNILTALLSLVITAAIWCLTPNVRSSDLEVILFLLAILMSIVTLGLIIYLITKLLKKDVSIYKVFAVTDFVVALIATIIALSDIYTSSGFLAGLFGTLVLITVVPIAVGLAIVDYILYYLDKKKKESK